MLLVDHRVARPRRPASLHERHSPGADEQHARRAEQLSIRQRRKTSYTVDDAALRRGARQSVTRRDCTQRDALSDR